MLDLTNHTGYLDRTFCTGQTPANDFSAGDGLNYAGYVFRAPTKLDNDVFIARLDYHLTADGKHSLFWRGNLNDSRNSGAPFLPGKYQTLPGELNPSAPMQTIADHSKGFAFGYTAILNPTMVNSFHWGYTRQSSGVVGNTNQQWNEFLGLDQGVNFSHNFQLPLHNFVDDFSWTKGTHSFQFGTSIKIARNPRTSFLHSNTLALGTTNWTSPIGFAGTTSTLDPDQRASAHPLINAPEPLTATQYDRPLLSLYGMISDVVANYNLDPMATWCRDPVSWRNLWRPGQPALWPRFVRVLRPGHLAHQAESHADLRTALVVLSGAVGDQRFPGIDLIRPGNPVRSKREKHEPRHWLWRNAVDQFQPEWSGEQRGQVFIPWKRRTGRRESRSLTRRDSIRAVEEQSLATTTGP